MSSANIPLESRLLDLFAHLGIERAHIAARGPNDWSGLVRHHPEAVSSLTLICPNGVASDSLRNVEPRTLILSGDRGVSFDSLPLDNLPDAQVGLLPDYETLGWTDVMADRTDEISSRMIAFLEGPSPSPSQTMAPPDESEGEIAGLTYCVRGSGPPLVLLPLFLAPSQWEPLISILTERFSTITLGGPLLGPVVMLEARGKTRGYREMLSALLDETGLEPGDTVLEVGCGSGAVMRWLAEKTKGAIHIDGVDINAYLLREGKALARKAGCDEVITTREGSALSLPYPDNHFDVTYSVTVIEELDANVMIAEMMRVTKPGGQVGVICRALDLRWVMNAPVEPELRAKLEVEGIGGVDKLGCADASLYRRFREAGLNDIAAFPHLTPFTVTDTGILDFVEGGRLDAVTSEEAEAWRAARVKAEEDGSFFIAWPHHCAVGKKPE